MSDSVFNIDSVDLWAAAKFIGRECATINKDFVLCKKEHDQNPLPCLAQGDLVASCAGEVVNVLKTKYSQPFETFGKCLNYNDYRFDDCRKEEDALRKAWNADVQQQGQ
eukprot:gene3609-3951_t